MSDENKKYPRHNMDELMNDPEYREKLLNAMCVYAGPANPSVNSMNMMMVYAGPSQMNNSGGLMKQMSQQMMDRAAQQQKVQQQAQDLKEAQEQGRFPKFCPNCGSRLTILGKFCTECGGKLFV